MPDLLVNTTGEIALYVEAEGAPVPGREVLLTFTDPRGSVLLTDELAVDQGDGWYIATIDAANLLLRGTYKAQWDSPGAPAIHVLTLHSCGYVEPGTPTLAELRQRVARELGALLHRGRVTTASVTADSIVDASLAIGGDGEYAGCWVIMYSGTNLAQERRVTAYDADTHTLTVTPAFDAVPELGARYSLYHHLIRPSDITNAINDGIRAVGDSARLELVDEGLVTLADVPDYLVPDGMRSVHLVEVWNAESGRYDALEPEDWLLRPGGWIRLADAPTADDLGIRVAGLTAPETLEREGQFVPLRADYLIAYASEALHAQLGGGQQTDPDDHRRVQAYYGARREQERRRALGRIPANSRLVG